MCKRFQMIECCGKIFTSKHYINLTDAFPKPTFKGNLKVIIRKVTATVG